MPTRGSLSSAGGFVPTVIRIAECWYISPGAAIGNRNNSSPAIPVPNRMVLLSVVALVWMKEA